jgi:5-methylcytosine-specific restriction endonuclease McrA
MLLKSCGRCGKLIPYGSAYCSTCAPVVEAEREARRQEAKRESDRRYNQTRDKKYTRFYNSPDWRTLSARYQQDKGYRCEVCGVIANEVHHVKPIQTPEGWERRLDYSNLKLLCTRCHNDAHERFKRRMRYIKGYRKG